MIYQTKYANAYSEVYEILKHLEDDEYSKIPAALIEVIEENRNINYQYILDENKSLSEQNMLEETKAILLNLFRDYLANPTQKYKIKKWQEENRNAIIEKTNFQNLSNPLHNIYRTENIADAELYSNSNKLPINQKKESIISKIINRIRVFFKLK